MISKSTYIMLLTFFVTSSSRTLVAITCETRSGMNGLNALKVWNITGDALRRDGLVMVNVCEGVKWNTHHFLTKPLFYSNYIRTIVDNNRLVNFSFSYNTTYVILMDSDTFWSVSSINILWMKFDQIRNTKSPAAPIVVATEVQCWIGRYCDTNDVQRWYPDPNITSSYSLFVNSGFIMGKASNVLKMLEYIIENNKTYIINSGNKKIKFDDQFAITDYALSIAPHEVALDYQQSLSAGFSMHIAVGDTGWFICKANYQNISYRCGDNKNLSLRKEIIYMNETTCHVVRNGHLAQNTLHYPILRDLSANPVLWHGNGVGKRPSYYYSDKTFECHLKKWNISNTSEFMKVYKG